MGKLVTGPCWTDVTTLWWEIEQTYSATITLLVELDGSVGGSGVSVSALALDKRLVKLDDSSLAVSSMHWPHREALTFEIGLFKLLFEMERLIEAAKEVKAK